MLAADITAESERLRALRRLNVLDTPVEERFDDLTHLASMICETPVALVSLVDVDRQFFKSRHGIDICETDLERSVCFHAIRSDRTLVIEDVTKDARTRDNPLIEEMGMRFYAGVPLIGSEGLALGSLCVIDYRPRRLSPSQIDALERLARQAVTQLELGALLDETESARREAAEALHRADVLKEEIDHRVKNSLTQVAALLRLESAHVDLPEARAALDRARERVTTIANVHRELNARAGDRNVDIAPFLQGIADELRASLPAGVTLDPHLDSVTFGTRSAIHFAIILNECVANSVKYAFPEGTGGRIEVSGRREGDDYVFAITDNGVGRNDQPDGLRGPGLGMRIIEAAAQSLGSVAEHFDAEPGLGLRLRVPLKT